jgi:hypothetical protein
MLNKLPKQFFSLLVASQFIPQYAQGNPPTSTDQPAPQKSPSGDLSTATAEESIRGLEITLDESGLIAHLRGTVYQACLPHLAIHKPEVDAKGRAGFRLEDRGGFVSCQKQMTTQHPNCSNDAPCAYLSKLPNTSLNLTKASDGKVGLFVKDPNLDRDAAEHQTDFAGFDAPEFKSLATRKEEKEELARQKREETVKFYKNQLVNCRGSEEDLEKYDAALTALIELGVVEEDSTDVSKAKEEGRLARLRLIHQQIEKAKDSEALREAREKLLGFTEAYPDKASHDQSASLFVKLSNQFLSLGAREGNLGAGYQEARESLVAANELSELPDAARGRLRELDMSLAQEFANLASEKGQKSPEFIDAMKNLQAVNASHFKAGGCSKVDTAQSGYCQSVMKSYMSGQKFQQQAFAMETKIQQEALCNANPTLCAQLQQAQLASQSGSQNLPGFQFPTIAGIGNFSPNNTAVGNVTSPVVQPVISSGPNLGLQGTWNYMNSGFRPG